MTRRVVVVGGGIAGLAAAHRLTELQNDNALDLEVLLLESSTRLGGAIATERVGDFLVDSGPDSFITEKPWALRLCERLGLASRLVPTQSAHQKIYVVHQGKLQPLPEGFFLLAPTRFWPFVKTPIFSWSGKLRMAAEILLPRGATHEDESLGSFVRRRFGVELLERVAQPLIGGIYASDPDRLSLGASMPRFKEMEYRRRSVTLAMVYEQKRRTRSRDSGSGARWSLFVTLAGGMAELVDTVASRLHRACIRLETPVVRLTRDENRNLWIVSTAGDKRFEADGMVLTTPAFKAGEILEPVAPVAASELKKITYASTATVSLAYRMEDFPRPPDSFGFVVPAVEQRKIMACTFSSLKYPGRAPEGRVLLRAFVGGSLQPELFEDDDATMEKNVRGELWNLLGVKAQPLFSRIWRHPNSMPQYHVGHQERIRKIEAAVGALSGLALAGSAYHGVGIADCVRTGEEAADALIRQLSITKA